MVHPKVRFIRDFRLKSLGILAKVMKETGKMRSLVDPHTAAKCFSFIGCANQMILEKVPAFFPLIFC